MDKLLDSISSFFHGNISIHRYDGFSSIDMPMLNWDNDFIRFYAEDEGQDMLRLSDSRDTFNSLAALFTPDGNMVRKWNDIIAASIDRFGATINEQNEISMFCPKGKAGIGCFMFGQALSSACSSVGASAALSRIKTQKKEKLSVCFKNDLDRYKCKYISNYKLKGNVIEHSYDFFVRGRQDSLIRLLSDTSDSTKLYTIYEWNDVIDKNDKSVLYAISRTADEPKTSISRKISQTMNDRNIVALSYENDMQTIQKCILAS